MRQGVFAALLCVTGWTGCSSDLDGYLDIPFERRAQIIDEWYEILSTAFETGTQAEAFAQAQEYLDAQPEIGSVYTRVDDIDFAFEATFKNGLTFYLGELPGRANGPRTNGSFVQKQTALENTAGVVSGYKSLFINCSTDDWNEISNVNLYQSMALRAQYENPLTGNPDNCTVDFFKTLADYDVLFLQAHGKTWAMDEDSDVGALATSEVWTKTREQELFEEFSPRAGFISVMVINGVGYLAVSAKFLDAFVGEFPEYSMVLLSSCNSSRGAGVGHSVAATLRAHGAGAVLGWKYKVHPASALKAADYLFCTLFGENAEEAYRDPPAKPFGIAAAYHLGLTTKGLDIDTVNGAIMELLPPLSDLSSHDVQLRPILQKINTNWSDLELMLGARDRILLQGSFGSVKQGSVCVGSTCSPIIPTDMGQYFIAADVPPEAFGPVVVALDTIESNAVSLSQWQGSIDFNGEASPEKGPYVTGEMSFRFRADILPYRINPEEPPIPGTAASTTDFEQDGQCDLEFSGTYTVGSGPGWTYVYGGSATATAVKDQEGNADFWGTVNFMPDTGTTGISIGCEAPYQVTITDNETGATTTEQWTLYVTGTFDPTYAADGTIDGGQAMLSTNFMYPDMLTATWSSMTPEAGPSPSDQQ